MGSSRVVLGAALSNAGVGFFELSSESGLRLDDSFLTVLGYPRSAVGPDAHGFYLSLVNRDDLALVIEDHRRLLGRMVSQCRREFRLRFAHGGDVWIRCTASWECDRVVAAVQSVMELRALAAELEGARAKIEAITNNMPLGLVTFRLDSKDSDELVLEQANAAVRAMAPLDWRVGSPARELFKGASTEDFDKRVAVARGAAPLMETQRNYVDGKMRGAFDTVFFNSGFGEVTGILHDVTEHLRIQDELRRSNEHLEQFACGIAHDLQEPVRMVRAFAELLERELGEVPAKARLYLDFMREGASRMKSLIEDMLEYARLGKAKDPGAIDANAVLTGVLNDYAAAIAGSGAEVHAGQLPTVRCFEVELRQVLSNLVSNALKFRGPAAPRVEIRAIRRGAHEWEFTVEDNGIGLESGEVELAFRLFGRLHGRDQYEGNGIGLAVCKRIIDHIGGSIWIRSKPGQGTCVHFTLRAA